MTVRETLWETLADACATLENAGIDYRVTGVAASNVYGRGLSTNVIDIAVESDDAVHAAVAALGLPAEPTFQGYDPYVQKLDGKDGYIRIQGDELGKPFTHPGLPFKVHDKGLLLDRLDIYGAVDGRVAAQAAFVALTLDAGKTAKYKGIWNRL
jgi:hypothetical protein